MMQLAIVVGYILGGLALMHAAFAGVFMAVFSRRSRCVADADWPTVAVLLSLRGADPSLADSLRGLLRQNYPHYEVRIVVDRQDDPAWAVVQQVIRETGAANVQVSPLQERRETCSLKCSALIQLVADLDEACEVVALVDADVMPHPEWLRELVTPLRQEGMGATHGNPWFMPEEACWGSLVRYLWNIPATIFRSLFGIVWGGTSAIRTSVVHRSGLMDKWEHSISSDAPVRQAVREQGLRIKCVPSLMMVNREECNLPFSINYIKRQLTSTRLYHPRWSPVVLHALATTGGLAIAVVLVLFGLAGGQLGVAAWAGGGLIIYWLVMLGLFGLLERSIRRIARARGEATMWLTPRTLAKVVLAIPLAHGLHLLAVLLATCKRRITWRGVTYQVRGPWDIRLVRYRPFERSSQAADTNTSL